MDSAAEIREHEVEVYLVLSTSRDDIYDALSRSGIAEGNLIGEALIQQVQVYPNDGDDDASE
jgi:hypothetical protein